MTHDSFPGHAILLAGGRGERLGELSRERPKPLLPVQGVPVVERLIDRLRLAGVRRCTVVTCHRAAEVEARLGDGRRLGVGIDFLRERWPLGTAGCLGLIERPDEPFYLVNADIVTDLCFRSLAERHLDSGAAATVAIRRHATTIPFGVVERDGDDTMIGYREKPTVESFIAAGISCLDPSVCGHVRRGEPTSLPDLLMRVLAAGERVKCHEITGLWRDIGDPRDYAASQSLPLPAMDLPVRRRLAG